MKLLLATVFCLAPFTFAWADQPFEIKGEGVRVVDVDRVIVIKEKATVVTSFPFTVEYPRLDNTLYFWTVPPGVYAVDRGNVLEIRQAPKGKLSINLKLWDAGVNQVKFAETSINIGDVPPGPNPEPVDEFSNALRGAYLSMPDKEGLSALIGFYEVAAETAKNESLKTWGDLFQVMVDASGPAGIKGKLPAVQKVIQKKLSEVFPTEKASDIVLDRGLASNTLAMVAASLRKVN